jgi:hypothetical protein
VKLEDGKVISEGWGLRSEGWSCEARGLKAKVVGFEESHALEIHNKGRLEGVCKILKGWQHNSYCTEMLQLSRLLFGVGKIWWWRWGFIVIPAGQEGKGVEQLRFWAAKGLSFL